MCALSGGPRLYYATLIAVVSPLIYSLSCRCCWPSGQLFFLLLSSAHLSSLLPPLSARSSSSLLFLPPGAAYTMLELVSRCAIEAMEESVNWSAMGELEKW